jgi:diketogulonate reductase-like aldo/keto reductase
MVPIIGARRVAQVEDNLGCLEFELSPEHLAQLDEASRVDLGFPHEFLAQETVRQIIYGDALPLIDHHRQPS